MPRIRRVGEKNYNRDELSVYVVYDSAGDEYVTRDRFWTSYFRDARIYKRMSDALNSLGYFSLKALEGRELKILKLTTRVADAESIPLTVEETYWEKYQREKREKAERERQEQSSLPAGSIGTRW